MSEHSKQAFLRDHEEAKRSKRSIGDKVFKWIWDGPNWRLNSLVAGGLAVSAVTAVAVSLPNGPVDIWGDRPDRSPEAEAEFFLRPLSDRARFEYQFLGRETWLKNGKGILGIFESKSPIGDDCLAGTDYDIRPSIIAGRRVYGEIAADAGVGRDESGHVVINSAASPEPLVFTVGEDGMLEPFSDWTVSALRSNNCA